MTIQFVIFFVRQFLEQVDGMPTDFTHKYLHPSRRARDESTLFATKARPHSEFTLP
jgi:hypothetical protein